MNLKKVLAMLLLVALCLTLVTGCGGQKEPDTSVDDAVVSESVSDEDASTENGDAAEDDATAADGEGDDTTSAEDDEKASTSKTKKSTTKKTSADKDSKETTAKKSTTKKSTTKKSGTSKTKKSTTNGFMDDDSVGTGESKAEETIIEGLPALSSKVTNKTVKLLTHVYPDSTNKKVTSKYIKQYDLTVEYVVVPYANKVTRLIQMIAANESPDVVGMDETYLTILQNNLAQPVEEYIDFKDKAWDSVRTTQNSRKWKGKIHEVIIHGVPSRVLWYNAKLFEEQGLKSPVKYYDEGQWNWDTFLKVAKQLTVDKNNDGVMDQYGFGGESLHFMFLGAVNESFVKMGADGKLTNNMRSANVSKAMNMYADVLLNEGIYCPDPTFEKLVNNQMAMGYYGTWNLNSVAGAADKVKAGSLAWVPAPAATKGGKNYNFPLYESSFIPKGASNPYGAGAYLTYTRYLDNYNSSQTDDTITAEMTRMYREACNNLMTSITNRDLKATVSIEHAVTQNLSKGNSWSSILEEFSPMLDSELANLPNN